MIADASGIFFVASQYCRFRICTVSILPMTMDPSELCEIWQHFHA
jgi:hypothetical protein